jgi:DNA-directed RNA polymerase II subunit RPB1
MPPPKKRGLIAKEKVAAPSNIIITEFLGALELPQKKVKFEPFFTTNTIVESNVRPEFIQPLCPPLVVDNQPRITASEMRNILKKSQESIPKAEMDYLQFTFISAEEIKSWSVLEITSTKLSGNNSVFDLRLGPNNMNDICATCNTKWKECPGHFGHITLPVRIPHPLRMKTIIEYLSIFCYECYRLVITDDRMMLLNIAKKKGDVRFKAIMAERKEITTCPHCDHNLPTFSYNEDFKFEGKYKTTKFSVSIDKIGEIFDNIPPSDIKELGLDETCVHPSNFLIGAVPVLPPCARTSVKGATGESHDDLTYNYIEIVKAVKNYGERKNQKDRAEDYDGICYRVRIMMDNSKQKSTNLNKRGLKSIKQRLTSKTGLIRGHIQGKRVDFCARSVITPEATGWVDELVVPECFAKILTYPVKVNQINLVKCQALLDQNKVNNIHRKGVSYTASKVLWTRGFELRENDEILRVNSKYPSGPLSRISVWGWMQDHKGEVPLLKSGDSVHRHNTTYTNVDIKQRKSYELQVGDEIDRQLQDGDWTLFNRQPTLWKGSMRAMKVKIREGKTFRFNMACTQAYNADHDGDEMNMFMAQSEETRAESQELVSVSKNFTSSQDSKPMLAIKQDAMTGAYKLTYGRVAIPKAQFMDCFTHERFELELYFHKCEHVLKVYRRLGYFAGLNTAAEIEAKENELLYCGHTLFSFLLPDDFEYLIYNDMSPLMTAQGKPQPVYITQGVLVTGTLNKTAMGSSSASLIHHLWKDYGEHKACWFVSMYQICLNFWLSNEGFSIGLEDCIPHNKDVIEAEIQKCFLKAHAIMQTEPDPEMQEFGVMSELNKAATVGQRHAVAALKKENNFVSIIKSGAKGDWLNVTQVTGLVGQQFVSAQRIPKNYGNRALPHYPKQGTRVNDLDTLGENASVSEITQLFQSRGFVTSSFYQGLSPTEYFFHAAGGREGLIDTGIKTADTGYGQRKLIKKMEDLRVSYTGAITNSMNSVIQFDYGGDNLDASHLINVADNSADKQFCFVHAKHLADKLNVQFEVNNN